MEPLHSRSTFFDCYEEREEAFRRQVDFRLARRYSGPALFWKDFSRISRAAMTGRAPGIVAYITSSPRDCLAFGTPRQVLTAALMTAGESGSDHRVQQVASRFGVSDQLAQPIRTLSGGETVKLAMAKTHISLARSSHLVVSSPFTWLSAGNRHMLDDLVEYCRQIDKPFSLLALNGEDDMSPIGPQDPFLALDPTTLRFSLRLTGVRIPLTLSLNPLTSGAGHAAIEDAHLELESPCLMTGENGQGKSLVARALCGALTMRGMAVIEASRASGAARLLFQDVLTQTLLRSFHALAGSGPVSNRGAVLGIYAGIRNGYAEALKGTPPSAGVNDPGAGRHSLLDIKAILVAARLAADPAAIVLDEPDWGLSRKSAIAFVSAVLSMAHRQGTPVILISHKPWWQPAARSAIAVSRTAGVRPEATDRPVFSIALRCQTGAP